MYPILVKNPYNRGNCDRKFEMCLKECLGSKILQAMKIRDKRTLSNTLLGIFPQISHQKAVTIILIKYIAKLNLT